MSRKNSVSMDLFDDASDSSVTADMSTGCLSRTVEVRNLDKASIHCKWVAGPVGELQIEAKVNDGDDWFDINTGTAWAVSALESEAQIFLAELPFTKIRLKYTATSGSGTMTAFLTGKTEGA